MDNGKDASTLQELKDYNNFLVGQIFTATSRDGITFLSNLFDISVESQSKISQLAKFATVCNSGDGTWPSGFTWKAVNGTDVPMTAKQMIDFNSVIGTFIKDATINGSTHTANINAMTDIPTLLAYDVTTGWPLKTTNYVLVSTIKAARIFSGVFSQISGTTTIPVDNTTPLVSEGTQIMSQVITPTDLSSQFVITANIFSDAGTNGSFLTVAVFRGSTCIGVVTNQGASRGLITLLTARGYNPQVRLTDSPNTLSPITYSIRIGSSSGTWYLNRTEDATFGGSPSMGWTITEIN